MGLCALLAAACAKPSARIDGTLTDAPGRQVIVKLLDAAGLCEKEWLDIMYEMM